MKLLHNIKEKVVSFGGWVKEKAKKTWGWIAAIFVGVAAAGTVGLGVLPSSVTPLPSEPLIFSETMREESSQYRILVDKRTNEIIPDFQKHASEGVLVGNAVRAGLGAEQDFEEVYVSKETYSSLVEDYQRAYESEKAVERQERATNLQMMRGKLKASGLTDEEITILQDLILSGARFNENPTQ